MRQEKYQKILISWYLLCYWRGICTVSFDEIDEGTQGELFFGTNLIILLHISDNIIDLSHTFWYNPDSLTKRVNFTRTRASI